MTQDEAVALIAGAVTTRGETWADFGAGSGTFTRALASLLGENGVVYAVDRDTAALRALERFATSGSAGMAEVRAHEGDFTRQIELPELDGALIANALHYVPYQDQAKVLAGVARQVRAAGAVVVIEYDRRNANRWVPYPISFADFAGVAHDAGLGQPVLLATRPSRFTGSIYATLVRVRRAGTDGG